MMRITFTFITLLFSFAFAQPVGQLYVQHYSTAGATLGYIDYPTEQYQIIETIQSSDLVASNEYLYAAGGFHQDAIFVYDRATHQRTLTLNNTQAQWLDLWGDQLVVASREAPYLRVYDPVQGYTETFSLLDSTVMPYGALDLLVVDDRAYVLLGASLVIVDLDLEDTLAVIPTPPPYLNQNQNTTLTDAGDYIYITVDYTTGGIRSSLLKVNKMTLQVDLAYHTEQYVNTFPPIAVGDSVFVLQNFSHYDLSDDSLYAIFGPSQYFHSVVEYDPISESIFTYGGVVAATDIQFHIAGQVSANVPLPGLSHIHFAQSSTTAIDDNGFEYISLEAYPNPTSDFLKLAWNEQQRIEKMRIINPKGQIVWEKNYNQFLQTAQIDVRELSHGGYFLEVQYEDNKATKAFVKW